MVQTLLRVLEPAILGIFQGWEARGLEDEAGACSFQGSEERWKPGVGWGMVIRWMEVFSKPPENSQALLLDSGSFLPGTWTQVRPASQRLPCSSLSAFPKVMAGEGRGTVEVRQ